MAQSYLVLIPYSGPPLVSAENAKVSGLVDPFQDGIDPTAFFPIQQWSVDVEQTLNIGSQSSGAGAGKVSFNPFSVTRNIDQVSTKLFTAAASGQPFQFADLIERRGGAGGQAQGHGASFVAWRFGLVAVKAVAWSSDDQTPRETVSFEYGSLTIQYFAQNPDGSSAAPVTSGWNRVTNTRV